MKRLEICTVCKSSKLDAELQDGAHGRRGTAGARGAAGGAPGAAVVVVAGIFVAQPWYALTWRRGGDIPRGIIRRSGFGHGARVATGRGGLIRPVERRGLPGKGGDDYPIYPRSFFCVFL